MRALVCVLLLSGCSIGGTVGGAVGAAVGTAAGTAVDVILRGEATPLDMETFGPGPDGKEEVTR